MSDLTRKLFAAETAAVNQHLNPSSALDEARAELQRHGHGPAFVAALEAFEAAVRANERGGATRAAHFREAADVVGNDDTCDCGGCDSCVPNKLAARLREMAEEAQP